ncbi:MAG TPA: CHAT domain-containing protein [Candidatus Sulfopaludibacter sp.]|nr:CHAT domain-containing protein [Candidatus Sulfopaludibacter sp.]
MGDLETAAGWMQGTLDRLTGPDRTQHLPEIQLQMATLRARQGRMPEALDLFRRGIDGADRAGNLNLYTIGWNRLGEEYLKNGELAAAEAAFLEAYRVRKFNRLPLDSSYRNLGRLRQMQGDLNSASHLLDRYVELAEQPHGPLPAWDVYHSRGRVRLAQGRLPEALADLRIAVRLARAWRWSAPADDAGRKGAEAMLDQVHAAFIEAGNRLYRQTHDPSLLRETFEVAEENRAASLRALASGGPSTGNPSPAWWEALLRLQRAETEAVRTSAPRAQEAAAAARAELSRMDAAAAAPSALPGRYHGLTERVQAALDPHSALLAFELGDSVSWMWAADRAGLVLYALPPRRELEAEIRVATQALREGRGDAPASGAALYRALFGRLAPRFRQKSRWLLALDQGRHSELVYSADQASLFDVPLAALPVETAGARPTYLAELHSTLVIPGAAYWADAVERRGTQPAAPVFVGIGDAIYNTADPRQPAAPKSRQPVHHVLAAWAAPRQQALALPRLVSSGAELDACARAWNGEEILLKGADASRASLEQQLRRNPAVIHFATHFLSSGEAPASALIALSLNSRGETELLSPEEISRWKVNAGLVVLSGCSSAGGAVAPGTGLLGLTRAWLAAGAHTVIGSHWTTPDDTGVLFSALYRRWRGRDGPDAAEALRLAQVEMLRSGDWRAQPRYWGAYLAVGTAQREAAR